ncbi:MAG: chemotaxis protein CheX, partial [Deltaproteobacteria bacterium]|nr:chemotaxis protein CheX [Deltaproteobacteria bacterium]
GATLNFTGPFAGSVYVLIPAKVVSEITANFLGLEKEETNEEQRRDTLKEALNMIGGHMFSLFDKEGDISLGLPELIEEDKLKYDNLGEIKGDIVFIETEDNRLAAGVIAEMK